MHLFKQLERPLRLKDEDGKPINRVAARLNYIFNSIREANEVRRSHRERQLEKRAERAKLQAACPPGAVVNEAYIDAGPRANMTYVPPPIWTAPLPVTQGKKK